MDDMTCKVFTDETGAVLAKACASGDAKIKFNVNDTLDGVTYENTYPTDSYADNLYISPIDYPVDKPWYQDVWDKLGWIHQPIETAWNTVPGFQFFGLTVAVVLGILALLKLAQYANKSDLAPDATLATTYMEELNYDSDMRAHQGNEDYAYDGEYDPR